jgi:hypothetical protein
MHRNKLATALANKTGADRMEHPAKREDLRRTSSRSDRNLKPYPSSRKRKRMERIDERIQSLMALANLSVNETNDACVFP